MDDKARKFYAKVEKYGGWQHVSAERVHSIFVDIVRPAEIGFILAKRGYWARQIDADIFQVLKLDALKAGACGLSYGLSLSYVPYPYVPKLRWHRTLKSVSLDLREQPQVHLMDPEHPRPDTEFCVASISLGENCLREEWEQGWKLCWPRIAAWFDATRTFDGILEKCSEHLGKGRSEIQYVPGARLVRAFTYAKMGQMNEAKIQMDIFLEERREGVEARTNLQTALDQVNSR